MLRIVHRKLQNLFSDRRFAEIRTGTIWALSARVAATGLAMGTNVLIARVYGAEPFGIVALMNSFLMFVTIFTVLGTDTSILRFIPEHTTRYSVTSAFLLYRKTQYFVAGISLLTGTACFFASPLIADRVFAKPHLSFVFALASVFVVFKSLMQLNTQAVRGLKLIKTFAFMQAMPALSMLVTLVGATIYSRDPNNPVYAQLSACLITAVLGAVVMDRAFKRRMIPDTPVNPVPIASILTVSTPMLMTHTMQFVIGQTGVILLGYFSTEADVGYYAAAVKLSTLTTFVLHAVNSISAPKFSELFHAGRMEDLFHVARKSTKLIFWTSAPILLGLLLLGKPLLALLFGAPFSASYHAMVFLVVGQFVNAISGSTGIFMNMTGHQTVFRNIVLFSAALNVAISLILIPRFGINGAAFAAMTCLAFWNIYTLLYIKTKYSRTIGYVPGIRTFGSPALRRPGP